MSALTVDPEIETVVLDEHEFSPVCAIAVVAIIEVFGFPIVLGTPTRCGRDASWVIVCRKCAHSSYACTDHKMQIEHHSSMICIYCTAEGPQAELFELVPIGLS